MRRRDFLYLLWAMPLSVGFAPESFTTIRRRSRNPSRDGCRPPPSFAPKKLLNEPSADATPEARIDSRKSQPTDAEYLEKIRSFNDPHPSDIYVPQAERPLLHSTVKRLRRLQRFIGYGNFHLLSFEDALELTQLHESRLGLFSQKELDFLEQLFYTDASHYGFFGDRVFEHITDRIPENEVMKIQGTGHWLYKGRPVETYERIRRDVGNHAILTSGVRGVMKQFLLFLDKAKQNRGNLSLASRSLAPPGFSYHGICDFDVGQRGFGIANFTERFTTSEVYQRMAKLDYVYIRYHQDNPLGVRFEPWHIKICR